MSEEKRENNIEEKIEHLSKQIDNIGLAEYVQFIANPKKLMLLNFILGLIRGLGMGIGFTILAAILIYAMRSWVNLPFIGKLIAELLRIVESYR